MSWTEWISVLKLSQMWEMELIRDLALHKIQFQIHNSDEWVAALKISTQLRIHGLRDLAIQILACKLNSLKKIELAIECGNQPWLIRGYTEFVTGTDDISAQDAEQLGLRRTSDLLRIRHRHQKCRSLYSPLSPSQASSPKSQHLTPHPYHISAQTYIRQPTLMPFVETNYITTSTLYSRWSCSNML